MQHIKGTIGRWQGAGLMATTLLGTGVFILPQMTIAVAQQGALWAWALLTIAIIPVALVFGLLAGRFPHAAGPAYFIEHAFGKTAGRTIGLMFLMVIPIGAPAAILMTFQFMNAIWPMTGISQLFAQLMMVAILLLLNIKGIQISAKLQFALTLAIVTIVVLLVGVSGVSIEQAAAPQMAASQAAVSQTVVSQLTASWSSSAVMLAVGIGFWSFLGIEAMTHLATEFKQPKKDMLPAMLIGTVLVGVIYLLCTWLLLVTPIEMSGVAMMAAFDYWLAQSVLQGWGTAIIGILGIASGLATVNVYAASAARLCWSFSQEGILPRYFSPLNKHGVPFRALAAILVVMALVIVATYVTQQDLESLIAWSNGVFVIIYLLAMLSAVKLLSKRFVPLVVSSCIFCIGLGIALAEYMVYALILVSLIAPLMWLQKSHLARKSAHKKVA